MFSNLFNKIIENLRNYNSEDKKEYCRRIYKKLFEVENQIKRDVSLQMDYKRDYDNFDSKLSIRLFQHQIESVYNMEDIERIKYKKLPNGKYLYTKLSILGDIPGYGKSMSVVSLLARDKMEWKENTEEIEEIPTHNGMHDMFHIIERSETTKIRENLIVASTSILAQWEEYLNYSKLKYLTIVDNKTIKTFVPNTYDVVLVSSSMYNNLIKSLPENKYTWKRLIYDEPGITHITNMLHIRAGFYWFITASWESMVYSVAGRRMHFLYKICMNIANNVSYFLIKNDDEFVKQSFIMPETKYVKHQCINPILLMAVGNHVSVDIARMIQGNNIKGALEALGSNEQGSLIDVITNKKKKELKVAEFKMDLHKDNKKEYEKWSGVADKLRETINDLEKKCKDMEKEDCPICYSELSNPLLSPCCQHMFCMGCIAEWFKNKATCPLCRAQSDISKMIVIENKENKQESVNKEKADKKSDYRQPMNKLDSLINIILESKEKSKFIVFSDFDESFKKIKTEMKEKKISFIELTGNKNTKVKKLESFKNDDINVILLNSKVNCAGINLQFVTDIIIYHDMEDDQKKQIIGRANRIGRSISLNVHEFVYV